MKRMTKREALELFRREVAPLVREQYGADDKIAMREAWNDWTDMQARDGVLSKREREWTNPF